MKWKASDIVPGTRYNTGEESEGERVICSARGGFFALEIRSGKIMFECDSDWQFASTLTSIGATKVLGPVVAHEITGGFVRGNYVVYEGKDDFLLLHEGAFITKGDETEVARCINEGEKRWAKK